MFRSPSHLVAVAALSLLGACSGGNTSLIIPSGNAGGTGSPGSAGSTGTATGTGGSNPSGAAGETQTSGTAGSSAAGQAGTGAAGSTGTAGSATSTAGTTGTGGTGTAGAPDGGTTGPGGAAGADNGDPPPPRPINITPGGGCNCDVPGVGSGQSMSVDTRKPIIGKLVIVLGGICGGPGGGGIEAFIKEYGFHVFDVATQTCVNSAPQMYKDIIAKTPLDPEANRQVGDARMDLWDGKGRVNWVTVAPGTSIVERTVAALKVGVANDPGGDWGFFLNTDGTLRTSDVWVVGYSWGSQAWGMIASYVRFGRVITTSGPQAEGFPNATWITMPGPNATPADRKYMAVGFVADYPSTNTLDTAPNTVTSMIDTTTHAGWIGPPMNVHPGDPGPFTGHHQFPMVGSNKDSPGGHTVFCQNDPMNGWIPICKYLFGITP